MRAWLDGWLFSPFPQHCTINFTATMFRIPHSDLVYRSLMRNLRLLEGLREKSQFKVLFTGLASADVAGMMQKLEPSIQVEVLGDNSRVDMGE